MLLRCLQGIQVPKFRWCCGTFQEFAATAALTALFPQWVLAGATWTSRLSLERLRNTQKTDGIISDLTDNTYLFLLCVFAVRSTERLLLSISVVPQRCGATSGPLNVVVVVAAATAGSSAGLRLLLSTCPRPVHCNLASSPQSECPSASLRRRTHEWNTMKLFGFTSTHFASLAQWQGFTRRVPVTFGCLIFLCKCSNSTRTEMLKSVCLVISCSICNVHFC